MKKTLISLFILVNLSGFIYFNYPGKVTRAGNKILNFILTEKMANEVKKPLRKIRVFLRFLGLSHKWHMFSGVSRNNWWILIKAYYKNQEEVVLPLPLQNTMATILEKYVFVFREPKFLINLYRDSLRRKSYAHFLCRKYSVNNGSPIDSISFESCEKNIVLPTKSKDFSTHLKSMITKEVLDTFNCKKV